MIKSVLHIQPKEKAGEGIKCRETITNKRKILSKIVGVNVVVQGKIHSLFVAWAYFHHVIQ